MSVRDPVDEGLPISDEARDALYLGILRRHIASMIAPLGHRTLADSLLALASTTSLGAEDDASDRARRALEASTRTPKISPFDDMQEPMVGGFITRAGPIPATELSTAEQGALARLALRPVFIGLERRVIESAINADVSVVRSILAAPRASSQARRSDAAGTWVVPLDERD
jgi:hypothetical protein